MRIRAVGSRSPDGRQVAISLVDPSASTAASTLFEGNKREQDRDHRDRLHRSGLGDQLRPRRARNRVVGPSLRGLRRGARLHREPAAGSPRLRSSRRLDARRNSRPDACRDDAGRSARGRRARTGEHSREISPSSARSSRGSTPWRRRAPSWRVRPRRSCRRNSPKTLGGRARCLVVHPSIRPISFPPPKSFRRPGPTRAAVERTAALLRAAGHAPIVMKREIDGFVMNRLQGALLEEAFRLVADGYARPRTSTSAIREGLALRWSFMGPFETIDLNAPGRGARLCRALPGDLRRHLPHRAVAGRLDRPSSGRDRGRAPRRLPGRAGSASARPGATGG